MRRVVLELRFRNQPRKNQPTIIFFLIYRLRLYKYYHIPPTVVYFNIRNKIFHSMLKIHLKIIFK